MLRKKTGFTLTEILIVIVIVGVMAGMAIPGYFNTIEETRANEATVNLQVIRAGQKVYALNNSNGFYWNPGTNPPVNGAVAVGVNGAGGINQTLNVDITTQFYNITSITANNGVTPRTFLAVATRNNVQGGGGRQISVTQN